MDKRGKTGRVEGIELVGEELKVVVVLDQTKASDPAPLPALAEPDAAHPPWPVLEVLKGSESSTPISCSSVRSVWR